MALIAFTLIVASISLFFCRSQAISTVVRLWHAPSRQSKEHHEIRESSAQKDGLLGPPNGVDRDLKSQPNTTHDTPNPATDMSIAASTINESAEPREISPETNHSESPKAKSPPQIQQDPSKPDKSTSPDTLLMPPPPRPTTKTSIPQPSHTNALRVPSTGLRPIRGPPAPSSLPRPSTLTPNNTSTTSTLPPSARPRKKVLLAPGHSALDWANLTRTSRPQDLSEVPFPQRITPSHLARATGRKGKPAWSSYNGRVYNIGPYLSFHPGGEAELMRAAGRDGQVLFEEIHSWINWENMLGPCLVGFMVSEPEVASGAGDMDGLD